MAIFTERLAVAWEIALRCPLVELGATKVRMATAEQFKLAFNAVPERHRFMDPSLPWGRNLALGDGLFLVDTSTIGTDTE